MALGGDVIELWIGLSWLVLVRGGGWDGWDTPWWRKRCTHATPGHMHDARPRATAGGTATGNGEGWGERGGGGGAG